MPDDVTAGDVAGADKLVQTPAAAPAPAAPAADAGKAADAGTIVNGDPGDDVQPRPDAPKPFPDDWREQMAGDDAKLLSKLKRYASPANYAKGFANLEARLSSGEFKRELAADATDEQRAAWRKENGVPEKWEGYEVKLASGVVPSEEDKPIVDSFRQFAHAKGLKPEAFNEYVGWYYDMQEQVVAQGQDDDRQHKQAAEDALRLEWGPDYRANINVLKTFLKEFDEPDNPRGQMLADAKMPDGRRLMNDPYWVNFFVDLARDRMDQRGLLPSGGAGNGVSLDGRLEEISKVRRENPDKYDADKKLQAEELELMDRKLKRDARQNRAA